MVTVNITVLFLVAEECGHKISCARGENGDEDGSLKKGKDGDKCRESGRMVVTCPPLEEESFEEDDAIQFPRRKMSLQKTCRKGRRSANVVKPESVKQRERKVREKCDKERREE